MKKTTEQMIEELNKECNESLNIVYIMSWEICSYDSKNFIAGNRIYAKGFREVVEKAMEKLGLRTETSQEEEEQMRINKKAENEKTIEDLIKTLRSRRKK